MTNAAMMNEEMAINNSIEMLTTLAKDEAIMAARTTDEAYESFKKYASVAKNEFASFIEDTSKAVECAELEECTGRRILTEAELDMVVGGSFKEWIKDKFNKVKNIVHKVKQTVTKVWDKSPAWVKGLVIGVVIASSLPLSIPEACIGIAVSTAVGYATDALKKL